LADAYTSLGLYVGAKGDFLFSENHSLNFQIGIAESRSVFYESSGSIRRWMLRTTTLLYGIDRIFWAFDLPFRFGANISYKYQTKAIGVGQA